MKVVVYIMAACLALGILIPLMFIGGICSKAVSETTAVAFDELGPKALNSKYEWFKDAASSLDSKLASLGALESKIGLLEDMYEGESRKDWAREDRITWSLWRSERDGVKISFNQLASEYNAEMAKFHTAFVNAGMMPQGGDGTVKREYATYIKE